MKARFEYPDYGTPSAFTNLQALSGQVVEVLEKLQDEDVYSGVDSIFSCKADNGEVFEAYGLELTFF